MEKDLKSNSDINIRQTNDDIPRFEVKYIPILMDLSSISRTTLQIRLPDKLIIEYILRSFIQFCLVSKEYLMERSVDGLIHKIYIKPSICKPINCVVFSNNINDFLRNETIVQYDISRNDDYTKFKINKNFSCDPYANSISNDNSGNECFILKFPCIGYFNSIYLTLLNIENLYK